MTFSSETRANRAQPRATAQNAGPTELRPARGGSRGPRPPRPGLARPRPRRTCGPEAGPTARPCRLDRGDPRQTTAAPDFRRYRVCNPQEPRAARFLVLIFGAHIRRGPRAPAEPAVPAACEPRKPDTNIRLAREAAAEPRAATPAPRGLARRLRQRAEHAQWAGRLWAGPGQVGGDSVPRQLVPSKPASREMVLSHWIPEGDPAGHPPSLRATASASGLRILWAETRHRVLAPLWAGFAGRGRERWEPWRHFSRWGPSVT